MSFPDMDAPKANPLLGTWRYPAPDDPDGIGYLHYSEKGCAFFSSRSMTFNGKHALVKLRYTLESESMIRVRSNGSPDGWLSTYYVEGDSLVLVTNGLRMECARISMDEIPDWFLEDLARALSLP